MIVSKYTTTFKVRPNRYIIFNFLSGHLDIADESVIEILNGIKNGKNYGGDLSEYLLERNYVFQEEEDQRRLLKSKFDRWKDCLSKTPPYITIIPTYFCNLQCVYCCETGVSRTPDVMSREVLEELFKTVNVIAQKHGGTPHIVLFGGEPLLRRKKQKLLISEIMEYSHEKNYPIADVVTNGVDLKHYGEILEKYDAKHVQVTLDGPKEIHDKRRVFPNGQGSFDKIVVGIEDIIERGISMDVRINVDNQNVSYLPNLADFILKRGWCEKENFRAHLGVVYEYGCKGYAHCRQDAEILSRIFELRKTHPQTKILEPAAWSLVTVAANAIKKKEAFQPRFTYCGANTTTYCLDLYGNIYACLDGVGRKEFVVGQFYPNLKIDENKLKLWRRNIFDIPKCKECDVALLCGGGCGFHTLLSGRTLDDPICHEPIKLLELVLDYFYPHIAPEDHEKSQYDKYEFGYSFIKR